MKIPLILSLLILAVGAFWGSREHHALANLREKHRLISQEACALGVSTDFSKPFTPGKSSARDRGDSDKKVKDFANEMVAFAKEMEEKEKGDKEPDPAMQKRRMEMMDAMYSLNASELKSLIAELKDRTDIDDEMRESMIASTFMALSEQHPETALVLLAESSDLMKGNPISKHVLFSSLSQWAKDQPLSALEWIKKNAEKYPDLVTDDAKRAVVTGAALTDIGLAFQLANELKLDETQNSYVFQIARAADTPERQSEVLDALRKQGAQTPDKEIAVQRLQEGVKRLFFEISRGGYAKSMAWLENAKLSSEETANLTGNLIYSQTKTETGKWLDWLSTQKMEKRQIESSTRRLVRSWTQKDYKAAGEWLVQVPAGPAKEAATMSYLETVAPYDPDVAVRWAQTLPEAKQKGAMKNIHSQLVQKDPGAAEEFAKQHDITDPSSAE